MMKNPLLHFSIIAAVAFLTSCNDTTDNTTAGKEDTGTIDLNKDVVSAENVFVYVPSPIETASLLKAAGATYNKDLLNDPRNVSKYTSTAALALNLGVYGTDLAFAGIFDQNAETMIYMNCTGKMADALHVSAAFDGDRHTRLEKNINNRDSVLSIITDSYWDCDALFQDNHQPQASSLMIAGGWIEGLYLACKVAEATNNNEIRIRIVDQRSALDKLITLLEKQDDAESKQLTGDLKKLKKIFDTLPKSSDGPVVSSTDSASGVTVIGEEKTTPESLNQLEFKQIIDQAAAIRSGIVSHN